MRVVCDQSWCFKDEEFKKADAALTLRRLFVFTIYEICAISYIYLFIAISADDRQRRVRDREKFLLLLLHVHQQFQYQK